MVGSGRGVDVAVGSGAAVRVGRLGAAVSIVGTGVIVGAGVQPVSKTINATAAMKFLNADC